MALYLLNSDRVPVEFTTERAQILAYPALPGSQLLSYRTSSVQLLVKELISSLYTIRYNIFRFTRNQAVESISRKRGVHSRALLQNDLHFSVEGLGNMHQREESVSMILSDTARCQALYEAGKEYKTLDIYLAPELIQHQAHIFPDLQVRAWEGESRSLLTQPFFITPSVRHVIDEILDCPYDEGTSPFFFDLKVQEYLYVLLERQGRPRTVKYRFTPYDEGQILLARELLLSRLDQPPLTIRELARKVGINEFKLKAGFKHYFGVGVFECFQNARMERARQLLLQSNRPLKDIREQAGYKRSSNFITAFRKYFGYTPASLRRQE